MKRLIHIALNSGLNEYRQKIKQYSRNAGNPEYYDALQTILAAFRRLIIRTADECEKVGNDASADLR